MSKQSLLGSAAFIRVSPQGNQLPQHFVVDEESNAFGPAQQNKSTAAKAAPRPTSPRQDSTNDPLGKQALLSGLDAAHPGRVTADAVFAQTAADADVVNVIARRVAPLVSQRRNVVMVFDGPPGGGKSCLMEVVLLDIVNAIKPAIQQADEAIREAATLSAEAPAAPQKRVEVTQGSHSSSTGAPGRASNTLHRSIPTGTGQGRASSSLGGRGTSTSSPTRRSTSGKHRPWSAVAPAGGQGKFSLICAVPKKNGSAEDGGEVIDLFAVSPSRLRSDRPLIPDLSDPSTISPLRSRPGSALGERSAQRARAQAGDDALQRGIYRPSLARARSPMQYASPSPAPTAGGGKPPMAVAPLPTLQRPPGSWGRSADSTMALEFDGNSYLDIPRWSHIDQLLTTSAGMTITFWIRPLPSPDVPVQSNLLTPSASISAVPSEPTAETVVEFFDPLDSRFRIIFQIHCDETATGREEGNVYVTLRDSANRRLEACFDRAVRFEQWHWIQVTFVPAQQSITLAINGKPARGKMTAMEKPTTFDGDRPKFGRLGARGVSRMGEHAIAEHLRAQVVDLTVVDPSNGHDIVRYPLAPFTLSTSARDGTRGKEPYSDDLGRCAPFTPPPGQPPLHTREVPFAVCAPSFDGATYINCGTVGDFLLRVPTATIDFQVRTTHTTHPMTIIGVTDTPGKHVGFGVELNTNVNGATQKHALGMWIQDYNGKHARVCVDVPNLFDGTWHKVSIRVLDVETPRFRIKIDGATLTENIQTAGKCRRDHMLASSETLSIGCHNNRGNLERFFEGGISGVRLRATGADGDPILIASWPLDEGPGAAIALDASGHGFQGIYNRAGKRGCVWLPMDADRGVPQAADGAAAADANIRIKRYDNNTVQLAAVAIRAVSLPGGRVREELVNLLPPQQVQPVAGTNPRHVVQQQQQPTYTSSYELEPIPAGSANPRLNMNDRRTLYCLPQDAYMPVSATDYAGIVKQALHKSSDYPQSHVVLVLKIGDSAFTCVDLIGIRTTSHAKYVPRQLSWVDVVVTSGIKTKQLNALNRGTGEVERAIARYGLCPSLYKRSLFHHPVEHFETESAVGNLVTFALLSGAEMTSLCYCAAVAPMSTLDEVASVTTIVDVMQRNNRLHAVMVLQKLARMLRARRIYTQLKNNAVDKENRQKAADNLRRAYPAQCEVRANRLCILVVAADLAMPGQSQVSNDLAKLMHWYATAGYQIQLLDASNATALFTAINNTKPDTKDHVVVHVIAPRYQGPALALESEATALRWLAGEETACRADIEAERVQQLITEHADYVAEFRVALSALKKRLDEEEAAAAKKKKKKAAPKKGAPPPPPPPPLPTVPSKIALTAPDPAALRRKLASEELAAPEAYSTLDQPSRIDGFLLGPSTGTVVNANPTSGSFVCLSQLRTAVVGDKPVRGRHALLIFDCVDAVTGTASCGVYASSGEFMVIKDGSGSKKPAKLAAATVAAAAQDGDVVLGSTPRKRWFMSYLIAQALRGCAVECVRIGKHPPPQHTSMETLMNYMHTKLSCFASRPLVDEKYFGEYVGDAWLASRLTTTKEERTKAKTASTAKRLLCRAVLRFIAYPTLADSGNVVTTGLVATALKSDALTRLVQAKLDAVVTPVTELKRVAPFGNVYFTAKEGLTPFQRHPFAKDVLYASISSQVLPALSSPTAAMALSDTAVNIKGNTSVVFDVDALRQLPVLPNPGAAPPPPVPDQPPLTAAQLARDYVTIFNTRKDHVDDVVMPSLPKLASSCTSIGPLSVQSIHVDIAAYFTVHEKFVFHVDKGARTGRFDVPRGDPALPLPNCEVQMISCQPVLERDMSEYDAHDKCVQLHEVALQQELKQRIAREQEQRQRREEARVAREAKFSGAMDKLDEFNRVFGPGNKAPAADDVAGLFDVPLVDVYSAALESLGRAVTSGAADADATWLAVPGRVIAAQLENLRKIDGTDPQSAATMLIESPKLIGALCKCCAAWMASKVSPDVTVPQSLVLMALVCKPIAVLLQGGKDASSSRREAQRQIYAALTSLSTQWKNVSVPLVNETSLLDVIGRVFGNTSDAAPIPLEAAQGLWAWSASALTEVVATSVSSLSAAALSSSQGVSHLMYTTEKASTRCADAPDVTAAVLATTKTICAADRSKWAWAHGLLDRGVVAAAVSQLQTTAVPLADVAALAAAVVDNAQADATLLLIHAAMGPLVASNAPHTDWWPESKAAARAAVLGATPSP